VNQTGPRGELLVAEQLMAHGWTVTAPLVTAAHYDLLAVKERGVFRRIQVKTTAGQHTYKSSRPHYSFQLARGPGSRKRYSPDELDFFVCCALDAHRFWVIPYDVNAAICIKIYNGTGSKIHDYESAWWLLDKAK
jgi:hypothetical protein